MDSLTQIVLGAAVAEAVAGKRLGAKAALWGAIGGTIPDLDVFLRFFYDPLDAALVHRGFSHSLLFALIIAPLLGWISHKLSKEKYTLKMWISLWFLSVVTHPMLDIFTNYGTQFLWPFSPRITFNTVFVIDPLYTIPFMIFLIGALLMKRESKRRRIWNWTGIVYSSLYLVWGVIIKLCILNSAPNYFSQANIHPKRVMVTPMPLTSFYWEMIAEDDTSYHIGYKSLFSDFNAKSIEHFQKNHHLLNQLDWKGPNRKKQIEYISNGYYSVQRIPNGLAVYDLRFGTTAQLTAGHETSPIMGYEIQLLSNNFDSLIPHRFGRFNHLKFGTYINNVFGKSY